MSAYNLEINKILTTRKVAQRYLLFIHFINTIVQKISNTDKISENHIN